MIRTCLSVLVATTLVGCRTCDEFIIREPQIVEVPVTAPCVAEMPPAPSSALLALPEGASLDDKVAAALRDLEDERRHTQEARAILLRCTKPP